MEGLSDDLRGMVGEGLLSVHQAAAMMTPDHPPPVPPPQPHAPAPAATNAATGDRTPRTPAAAHAMPTNPSPALRLSLARAILLRVEQLLPTLLLDNPVHTALHHALSATQQPLANFLLCDASACGDAPGTEDDAAAAPLPAQARRQERRQGQRHPPPALSACGLVFSAVNDAVIQRTLCLLPPTALAAVEQTAHFFRGMPALPPLPPPPPSRVALAVRGAVKAAGLEGHVTRGGLGLAPQGGDPRRALSRVGLSQPLRSLQGKQSTVTTTRSMKRS